MPKENNKGNISGKTVDRLIQIAESAIDRDVQISAEGLVKSKEVLREAKRLFEYATEIITLVRNNNKFAKTNAILLRVLLEIATNIALIIKYIHKHKTVQKQNEVLRAFEKRFCKEKLRHLKWRETSLQGVKDSLYVQEKIKSIEKDREFLEQKKQEHCKEITSDDPILDLVVKGNFYKRFEGMLEEGEEEYLHTFSIFYQNCSQYIHPNHTLFEKEVPVTNLSHIERSFGYIILRFDIICQNEILSDEDRKYLEEMVYKK